MAAVKNAVARDLARIKAEAQGLDDRRRAQIQNQVNTIDRLLHGATYDVEMATLHEELADTQVRLTEALAELEKLKKGQASGYDLGSS